MISHFTDFDSGTGSILIPSNSNLHYLEDKYSEQYLQNAGFVPLDPEFPGPGVIPAPDATNVASLLYLVYAMNQAFTHHNNSATGIAIYHFNGYYPLGPSFTPVVTFSPLAILSNPTNPPDIQTAAAMLDDLYQKWNWHQLAINLHGQGPVNNQVLMRRYLVANTPVNLTNYDFVNKVYLKNPPTITPNYQDFYNYVNGLRELANAHFEGGGETDPATYPALADSSQQHTQDITILACTLPTVTTINDAYLTIAWLRVLYGQEHT